MAASVYGAEEEDASDFEEEVQAATWARERSRWRSYIIEVLYDRYIGIYISIIYIIYIYIYYFYIIKYRIRCYMICRRDIYTYRSCLRPILQGRYQIIHPK